jgi:hypothetical protein
MDYPTQIDCIFLAADAQGRLAAMITAGEGPISAVVLESTFDVIAVEEMLLDMPIVGDATVFVDVPNPSSFIELSRRGLFVYDWTDVHRPRSQALGTYELVASPSVAIKANDLPVGLHGLPAMILSDGEIGTDHVDVEQA